MRLRASTPDDISNCSVALSYMPSLNVNGITAVDDNDKHMATILFDYWTVSAVQMHMWIENAMVLKNNFLPNECWRYLRENNKVLAIGVTPGDNAASLKLQHALGFEERYRIRDGWDKGVDMVISEKRLDE